MIAMLQFSAVAAGLVFLAGCGDKARDPRLTVLALALLVIFPLSIYLPKVAVFPAPLAVERSSIYPWMSVLSFVWGLGFLVAAVRLGIAARGISNWRKNSSLVDCVDRIEIRSLTGLRSPVAAGVFRPVVFVPEAWSCWSDDTRGIVLDHEMNHHRRHDPLSRWIAEIACAVNGYNPLVLWMARRLTVQCEFACDALVLSNGVPASDYARLLCDFAEDKMPSGPVLAMSVHSTLESRVRRMVRPRKEQGTIGLFTMITLAILSAGALASLGSRKGLEAPVSEDEVQRRWAANPFPTEE